MPKIRVVADSGHAGRRRERGVHQHDGRTGVRQEVRDRLGVVAGHPRVRKEPTEQVRADGRDLVEMQRTAGAGSERALGHDREHPGAGGRFEHGVAGAHGGGLQCRVGQRQGRGELLQAHLFLGPAGVRGLQRRQRREHGEHVRGAVRPGPGAAAHGAPVPLQKQHQRGLGRFVGVLPQPGAHGVGPAERPRHGVSQGRCVERPAALQDGQQGPGRGDEGFGPGGRRDRDSSTCVARVALRMGAASEVATAGCDRTLYRGCRPLQLSGHRIRSGSGGLARVGTCPPERWWQNAAVCRRTNRRDRPRQRARPGNVEHQPLS